MTITLSQLTDLQRVRVALSSLNTRITAVKVERSLNELLWMTVRGGVELPVDTGDGQLDDFEWFDSVQNFYRVTTVDPPPGLLLPGASGAFASTPDDPALDITGDIDLRCDASLDDWSVVQNLVAKYEATGDNRSYRLLTSSGLLRLEWSPDGTIASRLDAESTVTVPAGPGEQLAVGATLDVDDGSGGWVVTFYTAPSNAGPWAQLGTPVDNAGGGTTSIFAGTATLNVGAALNDGSSNPASGTIHAAEVRDGIDGTVVADPDFTAQPSGTASFDDDAGRTWTVNGTAEIATFETDSITPSLGGEVWLKSIQYPFLNRELPRVLRRDPSIGRRSRSQEFPATGRSVGVATTDLRLGQQFTLSVLVETDPLMWSRDMDLILASGELFFIHIPAGSPIPGGYVVIGDSNEQLLTGGAESPQEFTLPCTVIAPPGPLVVGTTLTWGTVERLYGSWEALVASNATWIDLLDTVGSPEDLVVL